MEHRVHHIPINKQTRPGSKAKMSTITIHSTANLRSTAQNERDWLVNPSNKRVASWHLAVDDKMSVEAIPLNEKAWHAGNTAGNNTSIGIEICESGDRAKTIANAVELTAKLLHERSWGVEQLRRHWDWSRKDCPRIFSANNWAEWYKFKTSVAAALEKLKPKTSNKPTIQYIQLRILGRQAAVKGTFVNNTNYIVVKGETIALRDIFEAMGFNVGWDQRTQTILVDK